MMRRKSLYFLPLLMLTMGACSDDGDENTPPVEAKPTLTIHAPAQALYMPGEGGSSSTVQITTNRDIEEITVSVEKEASSWCVAVMENDMLKITVITDNVSDKQRVANVVVAVGKEPDTISETLKVTQEVKSLEGPAATISVDPLSVVLEYTKDSSKEVVITTNQTVLEATVDAGSVSWCGAVITGTKLVITTLTENTEAAFNSGTITIVAGEGSNIAQTVVSVRQNGVSTSGLQIADMLEGGIVYWISEDKTKARVISINDATDIIWSSENETTGASGKDDGRANVALIKAMPNYSAGAYPAVKVCDDMGADWFLPARSELNEMFKGRDLDATLFDAALTSNGGTIMSLNAGYWTSSSHATDNLKAWYLKWGIANPQIHGNKTGKRPVRCIKEVVVQ